MNRITIIALILLAVVIVLVACNNDPVSHPLADNSMIEEASKRSPYPHRYCNPSEGCDKYYTLLCLDFGSVQWIEISVVMNITDSAVQMFSIPGHEGYNVTISFEVDLEGPLDDDEQEGTIWIPAKPAHDQYVDIVGDCIIYKTKNIPPSGINSATIALPIMPWFKTDNFTGHLWSYDLGIDASRCPAPFHKTELEIEWCPGASHIEVVLSDRDADPSNISDRVLDPVLGDEDFNP